MSLTELYRMYGEDKITRLMARPSQFRYMYCKVEEVLRNYANPSLSPNSLTSLQYYILLVLGDLDYNSCPIPKHTLALFSSRYVRPYMLATEKERHAALLRAQLTPTEYKALNEWDYIWK